MFIGLGTDFWGNSLFTLPSKQHFVEAEWLETAVKSIPLFFSFGGIFLATYQYTIGFNTLFNIKKYELGRSRYIFLNRKWFFDKVYNEWVALPLLKSAYTQTYQNIDRGLIELYGPNGIYKELANQSDSFKNSSQGFVFRNLFIMIATLSLAFRVIGDLAVCFQTFEINLICLLIYYSFFYFKK
jgi:NADH-ubiquinone oxidoreductase chain 5